MSIRDIFRLEIHVSPKGEIILLWLAFIVNAIFSAVTWVQFNEVFALNIFNAIVIVLILIQAAKNKKKSELHEPTNSEQKSESIGDSPRSGEKL